MCLWNTDAPGGNKVKLGQNSLSLTFWPRPTPRGMWCQWSVSNPKMNLQSKFGYCMTTQTLNNALCLLAGRNYGQTNGRTDRQTDGRTDDPNTRCPRRTFQAGGIKKSTKRAIKTHIFCWRDLSDLWMNVEVLSFLHLFPFIFVVIEQEAILHQNKPAIHIWNCRLINMYWQCCVAVDLFFLSPWQRKQHYQSGASLISVINNVTDFSYFSFKMLMRSPII